MLGEVFDLKNLLEDGGSEYLCRDSGWTCEGVRRV